MAGTNNWTVHWAGFQGIGNALIYKKNSSPPGFNGPGVVDLQPYLVAGSYTTGGDLYLNGNYTWNMNGNMNNANKIADLETVVTHEMGHQVTLLHPGACGAMTTLEANSAMNPDWTKKWYINQDDKDGAAYVK